MQEFSPNIENSFKMMLEEYFYWFVNQFLLNLLSGGALVLSVHFKVV